MAKRLLIMMVAVCALQAAATATSPLGPPTAGLELGQYRVGADYGMFDADIDTDREEMDGFESNAWLANVGYGLADHLEIYGLLGASDGEVDDFDSGYETAYGFGAKATLAEQDNVCWGVVYQMLWINPEDTITEVVIEDGTTVSDIEIDAYEIKAAFGPTYKGPGWQLYGGPMLYYISGDVEVSNPVAGFPVSADADIDQDLQIGGYVGAGLDLAENMCLRGEYQYTHDVETIGVSLQWMF